MVMFCKYGRNEAKLMYIEFAAIAHRTPYLNHRSEPLRACP